MARGEAVRLNIGSGAPGPEGWTNINLLPGENIDYAIDVRDGLPFDDNSVDYAVCHHVFDLLTFDEMTRLLEEVHRVLRPEARFRASGADVMRGAARAIAGDWEWFAELRSSMEETVGFFITQGGARKQMLPVEAVVGACKKVGFRSAMIDVWDYEGPDFLRSLDSRRRESWFAEARK